MNLNLILIFLSKIMVKMWEKQDVRLPVAFDFLQLAEIRVCSIRYSGCRKNGKVRVEWIRWSEGKSSFSSR